MTGTSRQAPPGAPGREAPAAPAANGYAPRRTLPLRTEAIRQLRRRRTLVMALLLAGLPCVVAAAFAVGGAPDGSEDATLVRGATASAANFAVACLFLSTGFLLAVPVALFFGDTVASEASWSSLRYLLAAPVPRGRLLAAKFAVALAFSAAGLALLPLTALGLGAVLYGWGPLELPTGGTLPATEAAGRLAAVTAYVLAGHLVTAALAFWLSTVTDAPLGAVGGALGLTIVGSILDAITALGDWRDFLPAHWSYAWADAFQPRPEWTGMLQGTSVSLSYALVLGALAVRRFRAKDIVS